MTKIIPNYNKHNIKIIKRKKLLKLINIILNLNQITKISILTKISIKNICTIKKISKIKKLLTYSIKSHKLIKIKEKNNSNPNIKNTKT